MMRREYIRQPSLAASWSLSPAVFSLVLAFVATLSHRSGVLSSQNFVLVAVTAFFFAALGFLLSLLGLYALWNDAAKGGRKSTWAFFTSMPVLLFGILALSMTAITAPLSDISTDRSDPPHFTTANVSNDSENLNEPPRINAQVQFDFYPQLAGRRYALPADTILGHVLAQMTENNWDLTYENPRSMGNGEWMLEASVKTVLFGFVDQVIVRVTDEGNATFVDMRSASKFGSRDFGANARRIEKFMKELDQRISFQAG